MLAVTDWLGVYDETPTAKAPAALASVEEAYDPVYRC